MAGLRTALVWAALGLAVVVPLIVTASSPLLGGRDAVYVAAGLGGALALALMLVQPLLVAGYLPGLRRPSERRWHRWIGAVILSAVAVHILGLYLTSPPDALDALLLVSPTPFSVYGVIGMWGLILTGLLVALRGRIGLRYRAWNVVHNALALVVVVASVVHAVLIEGAMGSLSKAILCGLILLATAVVLLHLRIVRPLLARR